MMCFSEREKWLTIGTKKIHQDEAEKEEKKNDEKEDRKAIKNNGRILEPFIKVFSSFCERLSGRKKKKN